MYKKGVSFKKHNVVLFVIFSLFFSSMIPATHFPDLSSDEQETNSKGKNKYIFFKELLDEELTIWTSPFRIKRKNAIFLGALAISTAVLIHNDEYLIKKAKKFTESSPWVKDISSVLTNLGSAPYDLVLIGAFYTGGIIFKDKHARETAALSLRSLIHSIFVSQVFKLIFRRQRPDFENGIDKWFNPGIGKAFRSFPSGHTAQVWSIATVIAGRYKDKPLIPVVCYSLAALAGVTRLTENEHWASDILLGTVIGFSIGRLVLRKNNKNLVISPLMSGNKYGFNLSLVF